MKLLKLIIFLGMACNVCVGMDKKERKNHNYEKMTDTELFNVYSNDPKNQKILDAVVKRPEVRKKFLNHFEDNAGRVITFLKGFLSIDLKIEDDLKASLEMCAFLRYFLKVYFVKRVETLQSTSEMVVDGLLDMQKDIEEFDVKMKKKIEDDKKKYEE